MSNVVGRFGERGSEGALEFPSGNKIDLKVRRTCEQCNTGWMSDLEHAAKPIIEPMIRAEQTLLGPREQEVVARWATKTAMMLDLVGPGQQEIPPEHLLHLFETGNPPANVRVWLAARTLIEEERLPSVEMLYAHTGALRFQLSTGELDGYLSTLAPGFLVCQVLGLLPLEQYPPFEHGTVREEPIVHVWPSTDRLLPWPPAIVLGPDVLQPFAELAGPVNVVFRPVDR